MNNEDNNWRTATFRQNIIAKIEEAMQQSAMPTNKSSSEMESHVFNKAKNKEEYLGYVARLILHVRDINNPAGPKKPNMQQTSADPMNALRAMTQPGAPGQMMNIPQQGAPPQINPASNLLQSLNQRPNLQNKIAAMQTGVMGQMGGPMVTGTIPNQMAMNAQISNTMPGPMPGQMAGVMANQMTSGQVPTQMNTGMPQAQMSNAMPGPMPGQMAGVMANQMTGGQVPTQMNTGMPHAQMSNAMAGPGRICFYQHPAFSSAPGMAPSPSTSTTLNTPGGQSQPTPSPLSTNEEQAFQEKVRQLSRYIEPLRKVIQRSGSGDHEKTSKMKKLLEILTSSGHSGQRITMETLLKCEVVLEKMDIKCGMKEQHPLIEAISTTLQHANANHTLNRTFEPIMSMLNGKPLKNTPRTLKRKMVEEVVSEIPEVLQGEVARLDQRFKVSLDPVQQNSSKCIHLLCWLDDRHLPCIPPVQIMIPEDYPNSSPKCDMSKYEYGATKFLQLIQEALRSRISKLPPKYTMSQLLDTWENSVRETCSSEHSGNVDLLPLFVN